MLCDWKVARREAQRLIGLGEVNRDRIVDAGCDACGGQGLLDGFPLRDPHHVEMVDWSRPEWHVRAHDRFSGVGEELTVLARPLPPLLVPLRQMTKLH